MKAITFDSFGGPDVLTISELPAPQPGHNEVIVKVAATTVNPTDIMMRNGTHSAMLSHLSPPYIAGMEFSGILIDPGSSGLQLGQRVIGVVNPRTPRGGAYAEKIAVSARSIAPLSPEIDLLAAATVPMNALTAIMALRFLSLKPGQTLLITGGAGMLGGSAIQLAKAAGLIVIANVGEKDHELVKDFGADHLLPRDNGLEDALSAICPNGVDGMVDGALIGRKFSRLVRDLGGIVSVRSSYKIEDPRLRVHNVAVTTGMEEFSTLKHIADLLRTGLLAARVAEGGIYNYVDAVAAHQAAEAVGKRGRVVLSFGGVFG